MRNYKPLFDEKQIKETLEMVGREVHHNTLQEYRNRTEQKLSHRDTVNRILSFVKDNHISPTEMKVFNKILGDHDILDKLVFVWDGSYRMQRIFYQKRRKDDKNSFDIESTWLYRNRKNIEYKMSQIEKLNFLKNNYDTIFIQLISDEEAKRDWELDDCYDQMYNDYYDTLYDEDNNVE